MAYRPPRKAPEFADLKIVLAQTRETEDPLYQVVQEIIERLASIRFDVEPVVATGPGPGGGGGNTDATYLTKNNEVATLPNSAQLLARYGIKFDDSLANKRIVDLDLEYTGNFLAGPQYSDGDIVVATDNVAYLCVRPTTNPPVPWPGIGIVSPPVAPDATYWTVSNHPNLSAERALNLLANGYVKSTAGEPSTIAVIPVSEGGTSATNPPNARTNLGIGTMGVQNADNVAITGGTVTAGYIRSTGNMDVAGLLTVTGPMVGLAYLHISTANPSLYLTDSSINARWQIWQYNANGWLFFTLSNADGTVPVHAATLDRTGVFTVAGGFVGGGFGITNLNASNLAFGTVPLPRIGTNTPAVGTFLGWDNQWRFPLSGESFPSGLIVISDSPCPAGWTRVNWDGLFIRSGPTIGVTGGSATHSHGAGSYAVPNHTHDAGSLTANSHSHGGQTGTVNISGSTNTTGDHAHTVNGSVSGTTSGPSTPTFNADAGGSGGVTLQGHSHEYNANFSVASNNAGNHSHTFSGSGTGSIPSEAVGISGNTGGSGAFGVVGGSDIQSNLPPFVDIYFCKKN